MQQGVKKIKKKNFLNTYAFFKLYSKLRFKYLSKLKCFGERIFSKNFFVLKISTVIYWCYEHSVSDYYYLQENYVFYIQICTLKRHTCIENFSFFYPPLIAIRINIQSICATYMSDPQLWTNFPVFLFKTTMVSDFMVEYFLVLKLYSPLNELFM